MTIFHCASIRTQSSLLLSFTVFVQRLKRVVAVLLGKAEQACASNHDTMRVCVPCAL